MTVTLYNVNTEKDFLKVVSKMLKDGIVWSSDFVLSNINGFNYHKKMYHGNSKMLLQVFYNDIQNRMEMKTTTKSIFNKSIFTSQCLNDSNLHKGSMSF